MRDTTEAFKDSIVNINSSIKNVNSTMLKYNEELKGTENSENAESVLGKRRDTVPDGYDFLSESDGNDSPCEMAIKRRMIQNASPSLISIMEKYRVKQTTSKFDFILDLTPKSKIEGEFEPKLWAELIADRPVIAETEYHKEIESICDHLFSPLCKKQYMTEIRIYMMEKRDVYRLHLLKSFNLPLSYSSYGNLRLALSWAWNIKGLVENLSFELDDRESVSSKTPERDPPNEMKTDVTPEKSKKKKL
ncbi:13114_t:CDS:2 [Acaulospora colombiana]|uniref:13114_t:CDS:1 n=1 Tax=Acaulospora colombiana TaxID=27376 RepID=A0ACA9M034_9GLOM|nr:13114_t:CDS:2 [Acaulospora colombiana]